MSTSKITGAQALFATLANLGVTTIFGYPGGHALGLYDALLDSKIHHVLTRHEQGAVHAADGYARCSGRVGVALVTSGPGATNTVTGIATAYMDSIPLVIITGQVSTDVIGTDSFQESDIFGITMPIVKHSYLAQRASDIPEIVTQAFHIANTGRKGPVLIDVPENVADQLVSFEIPEKVILPSYKPTVKGNVKQIKSALELITQAKKPLLYLGGGVISANACAHAYSLAQRFDLPIVTTLMGKGAINENSLHPLCLGVGGMYGSFAANRALKECDLLIACGVRFSDRATCKMTEFAKNAKTIHIDVDPAEIGKIRNVDVPIVGDVKNVFSQILDLEVAPIEHREWCETLLGYKKRYPLYDALIDKDSSSIAPEAVMESLCEIVGHQDVVVTTDVGQHQMWAAQLLKTINSRSFITSGGLGTMGFGLPAAIGASFALPEYEIYCITGDGSLQMNIQEMATATENSCPIKVILFNNNVLGMVRQMQKYNLGARYSQTEFSYSPNYVDLARAYGWQALRVCDRTELNDALLQMQSATMPFLLEVVIDKDQNVYPMASPQKDLCDSIGVIDKELGIKRQGICS